MKKNYPTITKLDIEDAGFPPVSEVLEKWKGKLRKEETI
jgi:uncharacterized protein (DUF433 family)